MKIFSKIFIALLVLSLLYFCNQKGQDEQTILKGKVSILVDESILPIVEDQVQVFESDYDAKITLVPKSEAEVLRAFFKDTMQVAVLTRKLTPLETNVFINKKITPKVTPFATDAIALIGNKNNNDTLIALQDVIDFMKGISKKNIKGLVFDNPNSSSLRYFNELAGLQSTPDKGVFSFKTNEEVIKYVSENSGIIGVVGVNWLVEPTANIEKYKEHIQVLSVKGLKTSGYYLPTQNNIAEHTYPLARDLYIINCQGFSGLGMGFASFMTGERGQRIILKSGLLPWKIPTRNISVRKTINNDKKE